MNAVPDGANLGLGCGNPVAIASLKEGDIVLDLGSGAGFDAFLSAQRVGKSGRVIGVDMTIEMLAKAKENATKGKYTNVEFRLDEIKKIISKKVSEENIEKVANKILGGKDEETISRNSGGCCGNKSSNFCC